MLRVKFALKFNKMLLFGIAFKCVRESINKMLLYPLFWNWQKHACDHYRVEEKKRLECAKPKSEPMNDLSLASAVIIIRYHLHFMITRNIDWYRFQFISMISFITADRFIVSHSIDSQSNGFSLVFFFFVVFKYTILLIRLVSIYGIVCAAYQKTTRLVSILLIFN